MSEHWDAIVVGAGICGLAAAFELTRRGQRAVVLEAGEVGCGQSAGDARIFRIAHTDPELCALALDARERWREWERVLGLCLLGDEGLVVTGGDAHAEAMREAGAPVEDLTRTEIGARIPLLREDHPYDTGIWDPLAGATRVRSTLDALAARLDVRRATVQAVHGDGTVVAGGETLAGDAVIVCAGLETQSLVTPLGLDLQLTTQPHVRIAYESRQRSACLIAPECYALPEGATLAIGMHTPGEAPDMFVPLAAVGELECVSLYAPWLDERGDGFTALRADRVIALGASNAMKFGPLLGDRLARSALEPAGVHADLRRSAARR